MLVRVAAASSLGERKRRRTGRVAWNREKDRSLGERRGEKGVETTGWRRVDRERCGGRGDLMGENGPSL